MRDTDDSREPERMVLLQLNQSYWLYRGEEFLNEFLLGEGYFPAPVQVVVFADLFELRIFLGEDADISDFWGINPDIVERLRRDGILVEIGAHEA